MTSVDADLNLSYIYIQYTTDSNAGIKFCGFTFVMRT